MTKQVPVWTKINQDRYWLFRVIAPRTPTDRTAWRPIGTASSLPAAHEQAATYQAVNFHQSTNILVYDSKEDRWL